MYVVVREGNGWIIGPANPAKGPKSKQWVARGTYPNLHTNAYQYKVVRLKAADPRLTSFQHEYLSDHRCLLDVVFKRCCPCVCTLSNDVLHSRVGIS
jgi:hypothetical protein